MEKHFEEWIELKKKIHFGESAPKINEGGVWWCGFGENVGIEINGKNLPKSDLNTIKKAFHELYQ